jgi:hypothetical protein
MEDVEELVNEINSIASELDSDKLEFTVRTNDERIVDGDDIDGPDKVQALMKIKKLNSKIDELDSIMENRDIGIEELNEHPDVEK